MTDKYDDAKTKSAQPNAAAVEVVAEPKIMCYVSKEMVPISMTVEVEYGRGKKVRVLPKYVKFGVTPVAN